MAGRPPKPTALKVLNGSAEHHPERQNPAEPKPPVAKTVPPAPAILPKDAWHAATWKWHAEAAIGMKVLTAADLHSLAMTVLALREYVDASSALDELGRPDWRRASDAWKRYMAGATRFGFDPSSRTRVHAADVAAPSEFEQFLGRGKNSG